MKTLAALALSAVLAPAFASETHVDAGPYVPSPESVVADMLKLAEVGPGDFVVDLGSGDGRIVLTAAKVFGARGLGVEIQEHLVKRSNEAARLAGVADRVKFLNQDLFKTDISQATVLTMYLLPNTVNMLKDKLLRELRPGARVVSHDYPIAGWLPERYVQMDLEQKVHISGTTTTILYLYVVPARVAGAWEAYLPAAYFAAKGPARLVLEQQVTRVSGSLRVAGREYALEEGKLRGEQLRFKLAGRDEWYTATVRGGRLDGAVSGAVALPWNAVRVQAR